MHFKKFLLALSIIFISSLSSCDIFSSTKISSSQIKKASSWSSKDQPPSFPECEGVEKKEQLKCLQNVISNQLKLAISDIEMFVSEPIDQEIVIDIMINKLGSHH